MVLSDPGPLPFTSNIGNAKSDAAFLEALKHCTSTDMGSRQRGEVTHAQLRKLKLRESDVAKVTREGISHLAFHPGASSLIIATGDKQGHIALWDVDKKAGAGVRTPILRCFGCCLHLLHWFCTCSLPVRLHSRHT
jgi:hypothetical protein